MKNSKKLSFVFFPLSRRTLMWILLLLGLGLGAVFAAEAAKPEGPKQQVMPAKNRAQILATAKALFEPQIKNSLKIGRVSSPFAPASVGGE